MFFHWSFLFVGVAFLLALWAQSKVKGTYKKFSQQRSRRGLRGVDVAQLVLRDAGLQHYPEVSGSAPPGACSIECVPGQLTDHYDPRTRTLRLSEAVYHGQDVAALGVAAHEVGHAIQHAQSYAPLALRSAMYPMASIGSNLGTTLFFVGIIASMFAGFGSSIMIAGILLFTAAVAFTVITLPVEFNASSRALRALASGGYLEPDEMSGARKVLNAAALTYVAAAAMAVAQLFHWIMIAMSQR